MPFKWAHDRANSRYRCFMWAKDKAGKSYGVWATARIRADCITDDCDWRWTAVANDSDGGVHAHKSGYAQTEVLARQQAEIALASIIEGL